ncbi:hypothetical protein OAO18_04095 [Francisellaceae bacterium]|nr:hypothetical protein [Francisellaceae bacterium]
METKIVDEYIYTGLLFPIKLEHVEMVFLDNEWHPKIDVIKISEKVIRQLITVPNKLTGNQIKFIRNYFNMSLRKFADTVVNETHNCVAKWEKFGDEPTKMDFNTEQSIRLFICEKTSDKNDFYEKYLSIRNLASKGLSDNAVLLDNVS